MPMAPPLGLWWSRPADRPTIDAFHKAAVDGDAELVGRMLDDVGRFSAHALLESRNSAGWTPLMWASWQAQVRPISSRRCWASPWRVSRWACAGCPTQVSCALSRRCQ
jgi:hypothetical protein